MRVRMVTENVNNPRASFDVNICGVHFEFIL